jgi:hypothetical protein
MDLQESDGEVTMMKWMVCLGAIALTVFAVPVSADFRLSDIGTPVEGNSWTQRFSITDTGDDGDTFDYMAVTILATGGSTTGFEDPAIATIDPVSPFTESLVTTPTTIDGIGENIGTLVFDLHFDGDAAGSSALLHIALFDKEYFGPDDWSWSTGVDVKAKWTGTQWLLGVGDSGDFNPIAVPVPAGVMLGMLGLSAAGWRLRKVR